jgi:hypothetical protein
VVTFHRITLAIADDEVALAETSSISGASTTNSGGVWFLAKGLHKGG